MILINRFSGVIVWVRVVPRKTGVGDIHQRFDSLSGSHHQSHVNCVSSVYGIYVFGKLSRDVTGCCFGKSCCYWHKIATIITLESSLKIPVGEGKVKSVAVVSWQPKGPSGRRLSPVSVV